MTLCVFTVTFFHFMFYVQSGTYVKEILGDEQKADLDYHSSLATL